MKANFLPKLFITKRIFWCLVLFATAGPVLGQSETNNPVTYDTTITETVAGQGTLSWLVRITRQQNDASQRPVILCIPGSGEVGTDPANLVKFGPHYWLQNGWDGHVTLDNGVHYPILVTIEQPGVNTRPWHLKAVLDILLNVLPIKRNSVHVSGLSQGSYEWGELISYAASNGDEAAMSEIKSWVDFEGVSPGDNFSGFNLLHPFGHWAKKYGGRMFGLEGTNDSRNIWQITEEMNDSVGNTGYFCYENFGGGAHCCWNSMYDPSVTNWRCLGTVTNANLSPATNPAATMGDYFVDPVTGTNVFQWMLRQGDTTLVTSATPPPVPLPTVSAGTTQSIQLPLSSVTLTGTAAAASGHSLVSTTWTKTSGPAGLTIGTASALSTSVTGLTAGTYVFTLTVTDDTGQTATSTVTITVLAEQPPTVSAGTGLSITLPVTIATLTGTATGNAGATIASTSWSFVSGPATPLIASVPALSTLVTAMLTQGSYVFKLTAIDNNGNSGSSTVTVTVNPLVIIPPPPPPPTTPPTVSAGTTVTITLPVSTASLTGTATGNAGSTISTTTWSFTSGPNTPVITTASSLSTTVTGLIQGSYIFTLTAVDNNGNTASSTVTVTVNPAVVIPPPPPPPPTTPPTVSAGTTVTITLPVSTASLTGTATGNAGSTISTTTWSFTSGPNTPVITTASSLSTTVTGLIQGSYIFTLTAVDNNGNTASSTVTVTVNPAVVIPPPPPPPPTTPPTVSAGTTVTITLPVSTASLTGTATGNAGSTISTTTWSFTSGPNTPVITTASSLSTTVTGLIQGSYIFTLTAVDNNGNTASSTVTVTVNPAVVIPPPPPPTTPPTVSAGTTVTITLPVSTASLTGTATGNAGSTISTTTWSFTSGPNTPVITTASSLSTTVTGLIQGSYIFTLTAVDNNGNTASSTVTVTVNPAVVIPPPPPPPPPPTGPAPKTLVGVGEYQAFFIDQNKHLFGIGTNIRTIGVGGNGIAGSALPLAVPTTLTFKMVAGGLHGGGAVDNNGNAWTWGDNSQGENGDGTVSATETMSPVQILTDISGNPFTGVASLCAFFANNQSSGWYAVKTNGTLWVWGQTLWGMEADGTMGQSVVSRPMQVPIPGGRQVAQIVAGQILIVLCTDGTVWICGGAAGNPQDLGYAATGTNYLSLHQLTTLSGITQIAGGSSFNYALKSNGTLYGWGYYGFDMGTGTNPIATPTDLSSVLALPHPVVQIVTNMVCTHAILTDGTLWGWGDNASGTIGSGGELNYATTTQPYAWDFYPYDLLQQVPVQITTRNDFVAVFGAQPFVLYTYAEASDGQLYSWGRNKTAVLGNGVVGCNPDVVAAYPDSWDVPKATPVNPLSVTATTVVPSPWCLSHATTTPCNECTAGIIPLANAGAAITITLPVNSTTLDGSASSNPGGGALSYAWTKVSGPASFAITSPAAATTGLTGLVQGVYTFQLTVTNSGGYSATATVTVTVNPAPVVTPIANAGNNITITLPINTVTLDGSASSNPGGGVLTYAWTKISGPAGFAIASPSAATTAVNNLVQGVYQFELIVTNSQGITANATVTVTVNPAPVITPIANAGNDITITLPVNTVTLDGSATSNPGGGVLTYAWTAISGPAGYTITSPSAATTSVTGLVQGSYVFQLTVTNSQGKTATATVTVTVDDPAAVTPIANAGTAITITLPVNIVTLDGSASSNPGGGTLTYSWTEVSGPAGNTITTPTGMTTTVTNLVQGVYQYRLVVTNSQGNTASASVTVTVNAAPVIIPIANAGTAITITLPVNTVTLDGSASSNPGGGTLTYSWSEISGPVGNTITTPAGMTTAVTGLVQGVYQFRLIVTNSQGNTATASVTVTVNPAPIVTPIANAGTAITITLPVNTVTLDGSGSTNPGGGTLSYSWTEISGPFIIQFCKSHQCDHGGQQPGARYLSVRADGHQQPGEYRYSLGHGDGECGRKRESTAYCQCGDQCHRYPSDLDRVIGWHQVQGSGWYYHRL